MTTMPDTYRMSKYLKASISVDELFPTGNYFPPAELTGNVTTSGEAQVTLRTQLECWPVIHMWISLEDLAPYIAAFLCATFLCGAPDSQDYCPLCNELLSECRCMPEWYDNGDGTSPASIR
jgi:hypothetical protein